MRDVFVVRARSAELLACGVFLVALGVGDVVLESSVPVGVVLIAFGVASIAGALRLRRAPPHLVAAERSVQLYGVELPWSEVRDVYVRHDDVPWRSRHYLVFRLARAPAGLVTVPLALTHTRWEDATAEIERRIDRPVLDWSESPEERRFAEAARR